MTKSGANYLKAAKLFSKGVFAFTVINSGVNVASALYNNDKNTAGIIGKALLDTTMAWVGFLGPIGFTVSASYFILDAAGTFDSWSKPENN